MVGPCKVVVFAMSIISVTIRRCPKDACYRCGAEGRRMNKTKIEYCDLTWNPITGCKHNCDYCYARKIAERYGLYGGNFDPQFHPEKLDEPLKEKKPMVIFVCDMGDIFSPGVKEEWRNQVMVAANRAPWHTYLWLTKNQAHKKAYDESWAKPNWWLGATITGPEDAWKREVMVGNNIWYSFEPLFGIPKDENLWDAKQVIIGRATKHKSAWCDAWAQSVTAYYERRGTKVFWKSNIGKPGPAKLCWTVAKRVEEAKKLTKPTQLSLGHKPEQRVAGTSVRG